MLVTAAAIGAVGVLMGVAVLVFVGVIMPVGVVVRMVVVVPAAAAPGLGVIVAMAMIVGMPMVVPVPMPVIMVAAAVGAVDVAGVALGLGAGGVVVGHGGAVAVGAALGVEGGAHEGDGVGAELLHQLDQHVIIADDERVGVDLDRGVAITEVPGDAGEAQRLGDGEAGEALGFGDDADEAAVVEFEAVAIGERRGVGEIEQEGEAADGRHGEASAVAVVEIEDHLVIGVGDGNRALAGGNGAQHGGLGSGEASCLIRRSRQQGDGEHGEGGAKV